MYLDKGDNIELSRIVWSTNLCYNIRKTLVWSRKQNVISSDLINLTKNILFGDYTN